MLPDRARGRGTLVGVLNGIIIVGFDVDPFIITSAPGLVFTGLGEWLSGEQTIIGVSQRLSTWTFINERLGIPLEFYYGLVIMLVVWYVLTFTPFGQRALFVGESREVARLSGFRVSSKPAAGFRDRRLRSRRSPGSCSRARTARRAPTPATRLLLPAYAAAFLGLTTIQPGRFNAIGAGDRRLLPCDRRLRARAARSPGLRPTALLRIGARYRGGHLAPHTSPPLRHLTAFRTTSRPAAMQPHNAIAEGGEISMLVPVKTSSHLLGGTVGPCAGTLDS